MKELGKNTAIEMLSTYEKNKNKIFYSFLQGHIWKKICNEFNYSYARKGLYRFLFPSVRLNTSLSVWMYLNPSEYIRYDNKHPFLKNQNIPDLLKEGEIMCNGDFLAFGRLLMESHVQGVH